MGANSYERDLRQARAALLGAVRRLERVMGRFEAGDVPLWPEPSGEFPAWTPEQHSIMIAASAAWSEMVKRRQDYESAARAAGQPSTWPHA